MAQALFDEHPLGEYLRDVGETPFSIPGITPDLEREIDPYYDVAEEASDEAQVDWCPPVLVECLENLQSFLSSTTHATRKPGPFVERFKYNVISSSLLAPSLPTPHSGRSPRTLHIPGRLTHSRTPSLETTRPISPSPVISSQDPSYGALTLTVALTAIFFSIGFSSLAVLSLFTTIFLMYKFIYTTDMPKHDLTSSFNALDDLISANEMWDSVVQDAVTLLDNEECNLLHTSTGPSSPSPIRVALHSSLQTTHTQCDNIRHLFSALTAPAELSQLSEMYAPPSPMKTVFVPEGNPRPFSYPLRSPMSPARTPESKRSTWNGSYSSLAYAGSPTNPMYRRRDKHRANASDVFDTRSAPVTPLPEPSATRLSELPEDEPFSSSSSSFSPIANNFGSAALDLQRKRKSGGMDSLRSPPASYSLPDLRSPRRFASTISSSSKFTNPQPSRHPLSYSALTYSLQGALSAKRYTCSHLLALRFSDEDDEGYWEDVRSVIGLLTSALVDASSRLSEALDEVEYQKFRDQNPTPDRSQFVEGDVDPMEAVETENAPKRQSKISFAPLPSHISRFAAHVAAISSALDDARENLEQCVTAIKSGPASATPLTSKALRHSRSFSRMLSPAGATEPEQGEPAALQAYERLRRELGLALRECERGRERLLEIINPSAIPSDDEEEFDDLPGLAHDACASDDSDKPDPTSPSWEDDAEVAAVAVTDPLATPDAERAFVDDANPHLLLTTSTQHLPLPGIEEVFEADTGARVAFSRERSKLSREERIKLAKVRRENGVGLGIGPVEAADEGSGEKPKMGGIEKWGPGGDVVQELKDVIWKVGERKRRMTVSVQAAQQTLTPTHSRALIQSSIPESILESS